VVPEHDPLRTSIADDLGSLAGVVVPSPAPPVVVALPPGTVVAEHFVIEEPLGTGGMGIVYRAHDQALDRKVALKLGTRELDLDRARREAQALARLAHPNVVTIHEVGTHDGHTFVAMELCAGGTARSWLRRAAPTWRDVLELYLAAGRGLSAAHAAGLVHRDVKPDNILIGADGRARIGDFGLARDASGLTPASATPTSSTESDDVVTKTTTTGPTPATPRSGQLTAAGAVVGTPRYMAPEQRESGAVDARADQYAFALSLDEGLAAAGGAPRRVLAVVARGKAAARDQRWPTMDAFVAALERAARPRWPWLAAALAVLVAGAAITFFVTRDDERARAAAAGGAAPGADACAGVDRDLAATWTPERRGAFVTAHGKAATTATWTADVLDHHGAAWTRARATVCESGVNDPTWSADLVARALECLARSKTALVGLAAVGDVAQAELVAATSAVADPTLCARKEQIALVRAEPLTPADEATRDTVIALADDAERAADRGDVEVARTLATQALERAKAGPPMARARAAQALGRIELATRGIDAAAEHFRAAYFDFRSVSESSHTYSTAFQLAQAYAGAGKADLAAEWLTHARAEADRLGAQPSRLAMLESVEALVARARGDHAGAVVAMERGIAALEGTGDPAMVPNTIRAYATQATFLAEAGRLDDSIAAARRALDAQEKLLGPDHPDLLASLGNIGLGYADQGKHADALPWLARARDLADRTLERDSMSRAMALLDYGQTLTAIRPAEAVPVLTEVVRIVEKNAGPKSDDARQVRDMLRAAQAAAR
jgi:tetratricopeptide (TPR) repeat protein